MRYDPAKQKAWRLANPEKCREYRRKWVAAHPEEVAVIKKRSVRKNRDNVNATKRRYYQEVEKFRLIPEKEAARQKQWRLAPGAVYRDRVSRYLRLRYQTDPAYRMLCISRSRIRSALANQSVRKNTRTVKLLGCTGKELLEYLVARFKPGMSVEGLLDGSIHVDHIRPCASFDLLDPEHQLACFHYTNLQPLWAGVNLQKSDRFEK